MPSQSRSQKNSTRKSSILQDNSFFFLHEAASNCLKWQGASSHTMNPAVSGHYRASVGSMRRILADLRSIAVVDILIILSFFFFLSLAEWFSAKIIRAGIIGQIAVGIIYGEPLANILKGPWQETFLAVGYIGLILIIFEGKSGFQPLNSIHVMLTF
jgi:hypothetical protein